MIVIEGRHGIHADAGVRQSTGDCRQKAYRFKRGMNSQCDHSRCKLIGETCGFGFLPPHDQSRPLAFMEDVHRLERSWNFFVFRYAAKNKDAVMHLGLHVLQQLLEIAFARQGRVRFQRVTRISHRGA